MIIAQYLGPEWSVLSFFVIDGGDFLWMELLYKSYEFY
ncbi:hypothetical protein LPST_C2183 [Lactiplantibacillus plantarum ST-III]|nr:hypothetical protein LPST_C2183 [Lactiplantibacillus plantarum ST-III]